VAPLVQALNQLIEQIQSVIDREKRVTGYAAHELRTPLAALKTQLQVALREKDPLMQQTMFGDVLSVVERMTYLVEQLLTLLRAQHNQIEMEQLSLSKLLQDIMERTHSKATAKEQMMM
jgi:two-component system, OmpR family, sensor histidine kinase QseC